MLRKIQEASNKTNSTDSVRWYTIPTDTAMPKADVTYNTIGFVGTVGTGATFTLYLDNEKTGAKTYHVYFKQLGGTGKLTLTTGKAGATNLTLNAGTYVAIIYVDENGNITNTASTPTATIEAGSTQPATSGGVATQITNTISGLSVSSVGGSGKYIEAISETDGKISATVQNIANEVTANNMQPVTSNAVAVALQSKVVNTWSVLCRKQTKTYIHPDVNTSGNNPKWIKIYIGFHSSYSDSTRISEYFVRLNYTPYGGADYRGLDYVFIAGIERQSTGYDALSNLGGTLSWDSGGIYINNPSTWAEMLVTVFSLYDKD